MHFTSPFSNGIVTLNALAHQIRVHLQFIGFPVANDPIYGDPVVWVRAALLITMVKGRAEPSCDVF
jgi:hypothetical protein